MYNKPIKQMGAIQTNVVDPTNTPIVPQQFQTGSYYDPTQVVQNPPQPAMNNQMGAQPLAQEYSKEINTRPMTKEQLNNYNSAVSSYKDSTSNWIKGKGPEPKVPNYTNFKLTDSEKKIYNK